jgi:hypothetical protein
MHGSADVAEDEVAVAVAPFQVRRGDFGVDHQHAPARCRRTALTACSMPKVADEQATFMSKP